MASFGNSQLDPYILSPQTQTISNVAGRTQVSPVLIAERTVVLLCYGQSNSIGAAVGSFYTPTNAAKVQNLNPFDGGIYLASEPLLGGGVSGGAWSTQLADALITDGKADRVIIQTIGIGGTLSAQWAVGGNLNHRIGVAVARYKSLGLTAATRTLILRHQGESDTAASTSGATYAASLASELATWTALLPGIPHFVGQVSYYAGTTSSAIIAAQAAVVDNVNFFSLGAFDVIGSANRISNIDYNGAGMTQATGIAKATVEAYINTH